MSSRLATLARPLCSKVSVSLEAARLGWPSRLAAGEDKGGGRSPRVLLAGVLGCLL